MCSQYPQYLANALICDPSRASTGDFDHPTQGPHSALASRMLLTIETFGVLCPQWLGRRACHLKNIGVFYGDGLVLNCLAPAFFAER